MHFLCPLGAPLVTTLWIIYLFYSYNLIVPTLHLLSRMNEPMLSDDDLGYRIGKPSKPLNSSPIDSRRGDRVGLGHLG